MKGFTTKIVHSDRSRSIEHGSLQKPIHATVAYGYEDARDLAAVFKGEATGYTYGRQVNPTVEALGEKISLLELGSNTVCFSTGMAAIGTTLFSLLREGDHLISSSYLFGNTNSLLNSFTAHGIDVSFVDATDANKVREAVTARTKAVFVETIANPRTQISSLAEIGRICKELGLVYIVDNTMTSPYLFQPTLVGASLSINSLTKYIGGHGNALGGSITELGNFDWAVFENIYENYRRGDVRDWALTQIKKKGLRDFGASLGPEAAHHIAVGAETLALRMERQCLNAKKIANFLETQPLVDRVYYPGLSSHPQKDLCDELFLQPGALLSFELVEDVDIWTFLNRLKVMVKSSNLGDNRTLVIPVAHTIYHEMGAKRRASMGIADSLIRISVGIEDAEDLLEDLEQSLKRGK